jgi:hypothetical protein
MVAAVLEAAHRPDPRTAGRHLPTPEGKMAILQVDTVKDVDEEGTPLVSRVVGGHDEVLLRTVGVALRATAGAVDVDTETVEVANVGPRRRLLPEAFLKPLSLVFLTLRHQMCACHIDTLSPFCATIRSASTFDLLVSPD